MEITDLTEAELEALRFLSTFDDGEDPTWDWDGYFKRVITLELLGERGLACKSWFYPSSWTLTPTGRALVKRLEGSK